MKAKEKIPTPAPDIKALQSALEVKERWWLHFYQLLYFQNTPLTNPEGRPFSVKWSTNHVNCLEVIPSISMGNRVVEYTFLIRPFLSTTQSDLDKDVLNKCNLILNAISSNAEKPDPRACCGLAETTGCVCAYSYRCPLHVGGCIGSHD